MSNSSTPLHSADEAAALTPDFLEGLRKNLELTTEDRARFNAITNSDIHQLALNREVVSGEDGHFSHRIPSKGITHQKASGRCWMFAGLNVLRPKIIHELGLEEFEFSAAYLLFWDKMEKSNLYLEAVIELREVDRLDREWQLVNQWMVGDGGWWNYVSALIQKYGVVPASVMPETKSSEATAGMNTVLERLLRSRAAAMLRASESGSGMEDLRTLKEEAMTEVYRFLVLNLGEPPAEFEWRYEAKKKEIKTEGLPKVPVESLTELRTYTPTSFYSEFVGVDLSEFVTLYHDPALELGQHYEFQRSHNVAGEPHMDFVTVEIEALKKMAIASVKANQPMWFAVQMHQDQSKEHGLMEAGLFDYESLFGIEMPLSKAERCRLNAGASNHAMVLMGVDLHEGQPRKWLVENSWGEEVGNKGTWTLYDRWFDEHVYTVTLRKDLVPEEVLAAFEDIPETLPTWYPAAMGIPAK